MMSVVTRDTLGNCAVLTLNRPDTLNAITSEMLNLLESHLDEIEQDESRAVILTGTGRGFCPGSDLKEPPEDPKMRIKHAHEVVLRLAEFPKITVAAINGLALGGGLEMALGCTFRVAAKEAKLGLPEIKIGLMPAYGGTVLLPRLVGEQRALQMMLSGEPVAGDEALKIGLVNAVCDTPAEVAQSAHDFVQQFTRHSLVPQRAIRQVLRQSTDLPLREALAHESEIMDTVSASEDCIEGVMSFIEKRAPTWKDR